ncbi:MAG: transglutaminase domain-containing protein, partial [Pseudomonadota bacterium]
MRKHLFCTFVLAAGVLSIGASEPGEDSQQEIRPVVQVPVTREDHTFKILDADGKVIGIQTEAFSDYGDESRSIRTRNMAFTVDGHDPISVEDWVEIRRDEEGKATNILVRSGHNGRRLRTRYTVHIDGRLATIARFPGDGPTRTTQMLPEGLPIRDPEAIAPSFEGQFLALNTSTGRFSVRSSQIVHQVENTGANGALHITYRDGFPVGVLVKQLNENGELISATLPQPGAPFRFERHDETDITPIKIDRSGRIGHPMVQSPHTISTSAKRGHVRYRITLAEELARFIPQNGQQAVEMSDEGVRLDICEECGPGLSTEPDQLAQWTRPTSWLQSDFPPIAKRGAEMAGKDLSDRRKLQLLGRTARSRMNALDHNGHYSAQSAWERGAGDCTEDAVMLAALARAAGIPTLVASGIAYSRERYHGAVNSFIPHAWIVAYADGEWISYDMTLDEGFGASHIALTLGEGEASMMAASNMIAGMLKWQCLSSLQTGSDRHHGNVRCGSQGISFGLRDRGLRQLPRWGQVRTCRHGHEHGGGTKRSCGTG